MSLFNDCNKTFNLNTFTMRQLEYEHQAAIWILRQLLENNKFKLEL